MGWNYRLVKHTNYCTKKNYVYYSVREIFYDNSGIPDGISSEDSGPVGETLEEFQEDFELYKKALEKSVLVFDWNLEKFVDEMPEV